MVGKAERPYASAGADGPSHFGFWIADFRSIENRKWSVSVFSAQGRSALARVSKGGDLEA
jgi:hypothetical protein